MKPRRARLTDAEVSSRRSAASRLTCPPQVTAAVDAAQTDKWSKVGHLCRAAAGRRGGGKLQQSLQTPERKRASQLTAECPRDRLRMEGCGEGRHEERQEEGGAPALPVQMRLKLLFARVGRGEKPNTPQKCEKRRSGSVRGGGGFT